MYMGNIYMYMYIAYGQFPYIQVKKFKVVRFD